MRGTFQARGHSTSAPFGQGWPRLSCRDRFGCVPTPHAILDRCPEAFTLICGASVAALGPFEKMLDLVKNHGTRKHHFGGLPHQLSSRTDIASVQCLGESRHYSRWLIDWNGMAHATASSCFSKADANQSVLIPRSARITCAPASGQPGDVSAGMGRGPAHVKPVDMSAVIACACEGSAIQILAIRERTAERVAFAHIRQGARGVARAAREPMLDIAGEVGRISDPLVEHLLADPVLVAIPIVRISVQMVRNPAIRTQCACRAVQIVLPAEVKDITGLNEFAEGLHEPLQAAIRRPDRACGLRLV
jgi:hypothetical protein